MSDESVAIPLEIERAIKEMPAISPVLGKINQISREMNTSPRDLVKVILMDPVLTGKVIKLVNSSFYALPQQINSLGQAVVLLGINTVKNLAISTSLISAAAVKRKNSPLPHEEFWRHCLATAVAGKFLARELSVSRGSLESYFIAGLLHDVGKLLFVRADTEKYTQALQQACKEDSSLEECETELFGFNHCQAGKLLAEKWKLDDFLVDVIANHHAPLEETVHEMREVVILADNLCKKLEIGLSGNREISRVMEQIPRRLKLREDSLAQVAEKLPGELEKAVEFLNVIGG